MKAVFIALFFCVAYANAARTCTPFADGCTCQRTDDPNTYALVTCQFSGSLPPLVSAATNFTIQELFINLDKATVFEIPAKYFANVRDVQQLFLQTVGQNTAEQKWDDTAFDGLQPTILKTIGVTKMFPLPTTLKKAAKNLQLMSIKTAGTVGLDDGNFDNFGSLNTLHVINFDDTLKINKISDNAFNGAEGLTFIWMPYTDVKDFPANAFKKLTKLTKLWLKAGNFQNFPKDSFSSLKQLVELDLSNYMPGEGTTNLAQAQKDGIFNSLSPTARTLTLDYTGLTSVPTQVLKKNAIFTVDNGSLELNGNPIKTIRKGDFKDPVTAFNFYLDDSPLETIEPKAFPPLLAGFLEFKNTSLTSLDLATFSYAEYMDEAHNVNLFFDQCKKLTTITISKFDDIPDSAVAHFSIKNTGLQTVDASIGNFLAAKPGFFIDISTSRNYICEGSDWMGRFVACTQQLVIDRTVCKDQKGMSLSDYLTRKGPITC